MVNHSRPYSTNPNVMSHGWNPICNPLNTVSPISMTMTANTTKMTISAPTFSAFNTQLCTFETIRTASPVQRRQILG